MKDVCVCASLISFAFPVCVCVYVINLFNGNCFILQK